MVAVQLVVASAIGWSSRGSLNKRSWGGTILDDRTKLRVLAWQVEEAEKGHEEDHVETLVYGED